jgi:hypothetical protein
MVEFVLLAFVKSAPRVEVSPSIQMRMGVEVAMFDASLRVKFHAPEASDVVA